MFAFGNELLHVGAQAPGARLRRRNGLVDNELGGEVGQHVALVLGGAAQAGIRNAGGFAVCICVAVGNLPPCGASLRCRT